MKERPIIFNADSIQAILDGRKTQTRRVMKPQPPEWVDSWGLTFFTPLGHMSGRGQYEGHLAEKFFRNPYSTDRLYVREMWTEGYNRPLIEGEGDDENAVSIIYKDGTEIYRPCPAATAEHWGDFSLDGDLNPIWKSPIFMPRWASRLTLEIVNVRVERLQAISGDDVMAEGVDSHVHSDADYWQRAQVDVFMHYWDTINAKRGFSWKENPFVWVIEFKPLVGRG